MLNREQIKYAAIMLMLMDHIIMIFPLCSGYTYKLLDGLSHFTFVSMAYFMVEGFFYTSSRRKYALRFAIFALISQLPYMLAFTKNGENIMSGLNVMFNFLFSFLMLCLLDSDLKPPVKTFGTVLLAGATVFCDCSVLFSSSVLLFYTLHKNGESRRDWLVFALLCIVFCIMDCGKRQSLSEAFLKCFAASWGIILAGLALLKLYNGKRSGKYPLLNKWLFYVFYPAHLLILGLVILFFN